MTGRIKLTKLESSSAGTKWRADFPSTMHKQGATYRVTTYPSSDLIFLETWVNRKQVSAARATRIISAIREELNAVGALGPARSAPLPDEDDEQMHTMREHRRKNFGITSAQMRQGEELFEGERVYRVTYNGSQDAAVVSLAPHEARKFFDLLAKDFGFSI
ncbi:MULTISPECIES: hypothetical protein [Cupriavidus]|jgi:hypothetical protein|uniref:hypothetical protein n=1 Tax=Cupriavidus TaxID=106589 RepID=UPI000463E1CB|nr:hypothetical protein [Cupriavidus metallidurans]AVA38289.1 hypothetical protein C3Z06_32305 [Cupriavidus metallidurans]KWW32293.1 hypothetical protein AU374_05893 [Cupriavidus metallidurans]